MVHTHPVIADRRAAQAAAVVVRDHIRALVVRVGQPLATTPLVHVVATRRVVVAVANRGRAINDARRRHVTEVAMIVPTPAAAIVVPTAVAAMIVVALILMLRARRLAVILRAPIALAREGRAGEQRNQKNPNSSAFHKCLLNSSTMVQTWGESLVRGG